jgi:hypothetical protein
MNRSDGGRNGWRTLWTALGVGVLVLLALAFGLMGSCGAWITATSLIDRDSSGYLGIAIFFAIMGLSVAGGLIWALRRIFRGRRGDRE